MDYLKLGRLNHVAIAVPNIEEATSLYRDIMGAKVSKPEVNVSPHVYINILRHNLITVLPLCS